MVLVIGDDIHVGVDQRQYYCLPLSSAVVFVFYPILLCSCGGGGYCLDVGYGIMPIIIDLVSTKMPATARMHAFARLFESSYNYIHPIFSFLRFFLGIWK